MTRFLLLHRLVRLLPTTGKTNDSLCWLLISPFPDVCDDYARHNGNGFWPKGEEPA